MNKLDSLRIHAHIEEITEPFDGGQWVEIKLKLDHRHDLQGECRLRLWASDIKELSIGQELCAVFYPLGSHP